MVAGALVVVAVCAVHVQHVISDGFAGSRSRAVRSIVLALLDGSESDGELRNVSEGKCGIGALCGGGGGGSVVMGLSSDGIIER